MIDRATNPITTEARNGLDGDVSLIDISNMLLRHRRLLIMLPLTLAVIFGAWSLTRTRMYRASALFMSSVPEGSSAASLARQFGIDLESSAPTQSPQFYADLPRTASLLRRALQSEVTAPAKDGSARRMTLHSYLESENGRKLSTQKAIERLQNRVGASVNRATGVVQLSVIAPDAAVGEQVADRLLKLVNEFILETRQTQAEDESRFVGVRMQQARGELLAAENALQRFLQRNRQIGNSPELVFEHERLQRQIGMRQEVYTALAQSYERARMNAARNTRSISIIDSAAGSAKPEPRGTVKRVFLALFLGLMGALVLSVISDYSRRGRLEQLEKYQEFEDLKRQAWEEIRNPRQWFRFRSTTMHTPS